MTSLEDRTDALEARVEQLAAENQHSTRLAVSAAREALNAQNAHQKNVRLLSTVRETQAEHTKMLVQHGKTLEEHGKRLDEHDRRFDAIDAKLVQHDRRFDTIDTKLGLLTVGMHSIESLLGRLVDEGDNGSGT